MHHLKVAVWFLAAAVIVAPSASISWAQGDGGSDISVANEEAFVDAMEQGERVFASNCDGCHAEGQIIGNNARLLSAPSVLIQIIEGGQQMPSFDRLLDSQIAAVATFVRNSFGNEYGLVTEAEVAEWR